MKKRETRWKKNEYYVSYRRHIKPLEEIIGYICEYEVYTDIFGKEYIKECPKKISPNRQVQELVADEDLKTGINQYRIVKRLHEEAEMNKKSSILLVLLGFILPLVLIIVTILLLYFFEKRL